MGVDPLEILKADGMKAVEDLIARSFTPRTAPRYQQLQGVLIGKTAYIRQRRDYGHCSLFWF